jgi:hypothetical protein
MKVFILFREALGFSFGVIDAARDNFRLARTAQAILATIGKRNALLQRSIQNYLVIFAAESLVFAIEGDQI